MYSTSGLCLVQLRYALGYVSIFYNFFMNHVLFGLHSGTIKQINGVLSEANKKQFKQN